MKLEILKKAVDKGQMLLKSALGKSVSPTTDGESTKEVAKIRVEKDSKWEAAARKAHGSAAVPGSSLPELKADNPFGDADDQEDRDEDMSLEEEIKALAGDEEPGSDDEELRKLVSGIDENEDEAGKADPEFEVAVEQDDEDEDEIPGMMGKADETEDEDLEKEVAKARRGVTKSSGYILSLLKSVKNPDTRRYLAALVLAMDKHVDAKMNLLTKSATLRIRRVEGKQLRLQKALGSYSEVNSRVIKQLVNEVDTVASTPLPLRGVVRTASGMPFAKKNMTKSQVKQRVTELCKSGKIDIMEIPKIEECINLTGTVPRNIEHMVYAAGAAAGK